MNSDAAHFLCPFLNHAVARERLVRVVPAQPQAPPELRMIPVPVMVETQYISAKMCAAGEHACLGGEHGLVMGVRDIGIASPAIVALVDHSQRYTPSIETVQVIVR